MKMTVVKKCLWCDSDTLDVFAKREDGADILKCQACKLFMVGRFPADLEEAYYSEEAYYEGDASSADVGYGEVYDLMAPGFLFWQNSLLEELNESHKPEHLLEIGCATGSLLEIIRDFQSNLSLEGIDLSKYAAKVGRQKGLKVTATSIEKYKAKRRADIIFSAETLEHLDNLKSFLEASKRNLNKDGVFVFYVPSISEADAAKERDNYARFNFPLEHLLHFTPEFFENELPKFFDAHALVKEFKTDFGPSIIGAVSKDKKKLANLEKLFIALEEEVIPKNVSDVFLKNLVVLSYKFSKFQLADKTLRVIESRKDFAEKDVYLLKGLAGYHKGKLIESSAAFEKLLRLSPGNQFAIRFMLANEKELNKIYQDEIRQLKTVQVNRPLSSKAANMLKKPKRIISRINNRRKS